MALPLDAGLGDIGWILIWTSFHLGSLNVACRQNARLTRFYDISSKLLQTPWLDSSGPSEAGKQGAQRCGPFHEPGRAELPLSLNNWAAQQRRPTNQKVHGQ
jgi:hypothetical protein